MSLSPKDSVMSVTVTMTSGQFQDFLQFLEDKESVKQEYFKRDAVVVKHTALCKTLEHAMSMIEDGSVIITDSDEALRAYSIASEHFKH